MQLLRFMLLVALATSTAAIAESPTTAPRTVGEFMLERQREIMTPSALYCAEAFPKRADEYFRANERFREIATEATKSLRERFSEILNEPMPAGSEEFNPAITLLERGKRQGASNYCAGLLRTMRETTVKVLREAVEEAFAQMARQANERKQAEGR